MNNTLIIDNKKLKYPLAVQKNQGNLHDLLHGVYDDISQVGGVTWLIEYQNHSFTHVDIKGNAHVAVLWKSNKGDIELRAETITGLLIVTIDLTSYSETLPSYNEIPLFLKKLMIPFGFCGYPFDVVIYSVDCCWIF